MDGTALSGPDLVVLLCILRLRMAVTVLRLPKADEDAVAEASFTTAGCNDPSPRPSDGSLVSIPILPAM